MRKSDDLRMNCMGELTKEELIITDYCELVGMSLKETTMMLLIFEDKTEKAQKKIMKKLPKIKDKFKIQDLFIDTK